MNKKIAINTVIGSFCIAWVLWICVIIANQFGYLRYGTPVSLLLFVLGALAPAIAAVMVLLKNKVMNAKQFFKKIFAVKQPVSMYLITIGFVAIYFGIGALTGLFEYNHNPIYLSLLSFPIMILVGGLEEVGWRFVFQPELEKKYPFALASAIVGVVWTVWHLPLFFIEGSSQNSMNFGIFFIGTIGLSFTYAAVYRLSKSVWLCIFIHSVADSLYNSFQVNAGDFNTAVIPAVIVMVVLILVSMVVLYIAKRTAPIRKKTVLS